MLHTESDCLNVPQDTDSRGLRETVGNFEIEGLLMLDVKKQKLVKDCILYVTFVIRTRGSYRVTLLLWS
jgi:hypothetical protein